MNKSLEAALRGYILFAVNGKRFWRYNTALAQRKATTGDVAFNGLHIFKGWVCFFLRVSKKGWDMELQNMELLQKLKENT
jgi:hypothetical protein